MSMSMKILMIILDKAAPAKIYIVSTKVKTSYADVKYFRGDSFYLDQRQRAYQKKSWMNMMALLSQCKKDQGV